MKLYLVRHAKAGSRSNWHGDDLDRPLSKNGWRQAEAIADRLAKRSINALVSSPYVRCHQTLVPLVERIDLPVAIDERLTEGSAFEGVLDLLAESGGGTVLCTHGDLVPETMMALERRGCRIHGDADWRKATVWVLDRDANGTITDAEVWPPPSWTEAS